MVSAMPGPRRAAKPAAARLGDRNYMTAASVPRAASATVSTRAEPVSVAVNPVTNKIYVANYASNNVTVIDGATNATATVTSVPPTNTPQPVTLSVSGSGEVWPVLGAVEPQFAADTAGYH